MIVQLYPLKCLYRLPFHCHIFVETPSQFLSLHSKVCLITYKSGPSPSFALSVLTEQTCCARSRIRCWAGCWETKDECLHPSATENWVQWIQPCAVSAVIEVRTQLWEDMGDSFTEEIAGPGTEGQAGAMA